ncbi:MAG: hypothetical protein QOC92_1869 [Acidimicrobiaceae bacterium]|jgi:hypothetical protein
MSLGGCASATAVGTSDASSSAGSSGTAKASPPPFFPLTGLKADSAASGRPALSIKIDNITGALPQSGLNNADIVVEELVEGGLTRLFATYQSRDADVVGPIRSARPVDADLLSQLGGGLFAYSGAAPGEIAPVEDHSGATLLNMESASSAFYRESSRRAPHNVYASTAALYGAGAEAGAPSNPPPALFKFGALTTGSPTTDADVPMGHLTSVAWRWNAINANYERDQNGAADVLDDGSRITTDNVLIMSVGVEGSGVRDVRGVEDPLVVVIGEGQCWLMRDGQLIEGRWSRAATNQPTVFRDNAGAEFVFHPGRSWVQLVQNSLTPSFQ